VGSGGRGLGLGGQWREGALSRDKATISVMLPGHTTQVMAAEAGDRVPGALPGGLDR